MEFLRFMFSGFWVFCGCVIIFISSLLFFEGIFDRIFGKKRSKKGEILASELEPTYCSKCKKNQEDVIVVYHPFTGRYHNVVWCCGSCGSVYEIGAQKRIRYKNLDHFHKIRFFQQVGAQG